MPLRSLWIFVTDLGDSAVTLPLAALILAFLLVLRQWRAAGAWIAMVVGCAMLIGGLKLVFGACGQLMPASGIASPSGHTAMSVAIYLSFALLLGRAAPPRLAAPIFAAAMVLIVAIGVSRIVLHAHDAVEVAIGFVVGLLAHAGFRILLSARGAPALPVLPMAVAALALVAALHGTRWKVEPRIHFVAAWLRLALPWCSESGRRAAFAAEPRWSIRQTSGTCRAKGQRPAS
ncbi:MAG TPA: phosphatase PAP2 family protein [Stellaceae bacterium]|nr:phosphatase PAP2 family protein [Stellaceae bacterium]